MACLVYRSHARAGLRLTKKVKELLEERTRSLRGPRGHGIYQIFTKSAPCLNVGVRTRSLCILRGQVRASFRHWGAHAEKIGSDLAVATISRVFFAPPPPPAEA